MAGDPYNPRKFRTPLPKEVVSAINERVEAALERDDDPTRRMTAVPEPKSNPSGEFYATVLSQLATLSAKMSVVDEIKVTTNTLRDKQQDVLVALARGDGRMNGLDQSMGVINSRVDGVIEEIRGTNNRLDRIERGESSSIHRAVKEPKTESAKKPSWISGAKALAIIIVAVGTAIASVVVVIVKSQTPPASASITQEPHK